MDGQAITDDDFRLVWLARKLCALESEHHDPDMMALVAPLPVVKTPMGSLPTMTRADYEGAYYLKPLWTLYVEQAERLMKAGLINFNE